jgi:hypothetical protein
MHYRHHIAKPLLYDVLFIRGVNFIKMSTKLSENKSYVDCKIDELLTTRNNLVENKKRIDRLLKQAFELKKDFPYRWYVTCVSKKDFQPVLDFLKSQNIQAYFQEGCGVGMIDGQLLFIPEDCNYDDKRELSIDEFHFIMKCRTA